MYKYAADLRMVTDERGNDGLIPQQHMNDGGFDAFWEPAGIFHDVFEHFFEDGPLFPSAGTLWGEMVASGFAVYFKDVLGINSFMHRDSYVRRDYTADTLYQLKNIHYEWKEEGKRKPIQYYTQYSLKHTDVTECSDPKNVALRMVIEEYKDKASTELSRDFCNELKLYSAITRYYRFGFTRAALIWQSVQRRRTDDHRKQLLDFLEKWHKIMQNHPEKLFIEDEYAYQIKGFIFRVTPHLKKAVTTFVVDQVNNTYDEEKLAWH